MAEHAELIENAFVNYLEPLAGWSAGLLIFPGENNLDKTGARIVAYVEGDLGEEDPPTSGNRWADVVVELRTPFQNKTPALNPQTQHSANAAILATAISSATLPDLLTAAIANFTCQGITERTPMRSQESNYWMSGWKVKIYSCPASFPN
jgi:hypothetical protein